LKELQELDQEIVQVRSTVQNFEVLLEEVDGPVLRSEQDVKGLQTRLQAIKLAENKVELNIEEKRIRSKKLQERMEGVRNVREEAAVHAELEMVRRALETDEQEALSLLDQIGRIEERLGEEELAYQEALTEIEPRRVELTQERQGAENLLEELEGKRGAFAEGIDPKERRIYENIMAGSGEVAVSELTQDGACGNCFSLVPLQIQNEIRHGSEMMRCEGCGVILTPESAEGIARAEVENTRISDALRATEAERAVIAESIAIEEAEELLVVETGEAMPTEEEAEPEVISDAIEEAEETLVVEAGEAMPTDEEAEPEVISEAGSETSTLKVDEDPPLSEVGGSDRSGDDETMDGEATDV
ncbi:MAG: hypothetical protein VYD78_07650, partial [Gemmatimonadota bacterium]|nr:hypothetical protein [Gemmatimonadota bacterium]